MDLHADVTNLAVSSMFLTIRKIKFWNRYKLRGKPKTGLQIKYKKMIKDMLGTFRPGEINDTVNYVDDEN